ncbi:MAG: hypothetical protein HRT90_00805 [Candidatus Margulisbacteria bacterium]|nr:hypothetical protein [Candidatus Margulisiibacteriota bacterium]
MTFFKILAVPNKSALFGKRTGSMWERSQVKKFFMSMNEKAKPVYFTFYGLLKEANRKEILSQSDECIFLELAHMYGSTIPGKKLFALINWGVRIKKELDSDIFQWVFIDVARQKRTSFENLLLLCQTISDISSLVPEKAEECIERVMDKGIQDINTIISELKKEKSVIMAELFPEKPIGEVNHEFSTLNRDVEHLLDTSELGEVIADYLDIQRLGKEMVALPVSDLQSQAKEIIRAGHWSPGDTTRFLAIARELIRRTYQIFPYNTQMYTVLGLLRYKPESLSGRLAQVRTGEGKSTIIALLSVLLAAKGLSVDIVTSSRYLAKRDEKKYRPFFELFGLSSSHICMERPTSKNFSGDIVFGTNTDFEFAIMRDQLFNAQSRVKNVGDRVVPKPFHAVIVDEVDNMFIDKSRNSARMGVSATSKDQWIFRLIFSFVSFGRASGFDPVSDFKARLKHIDPDRQWEFSDFDIRKWIVSAQGALTEYVEGRDYVVKIEENIGDDGSKSHQKSIVIMDYQHTGQLSTGSRWQNGIHEFLELKHGIKMGQKSKTGAAMGHPVYFGEYDQLFGLSGTMGSRVEREEIQNVYDVDTFDVPSHLTNRRVNLQPVYQHTKEEYYTYIFSEIDKMKALGRPVLILVRTTNDSLEISAKMKEKHMTHHVLNAIQEEDEDYIISRAGNAGMVTVATNTAGRGTDIILSRDALEAGGLHVIFGFYPINDRVEAQGIGRAGRQGQPGSSQIVVHSQDEAMAQIQLFEREELFRALLLGDASKLEIKSEQVFEKLKAARVQNTHMESISRQHHAKIEQINHEMLTQFYDKLRVWYQAIDDLYLEALSAKLAKQQLTKVVPEKTEDGYILSLGRMLDKLILEKNLKESRYRTVLEGVKRYIETKCILKPWADFYSQLGDVYQQCSLNGPQLVEEAYVEETERQFRELFDKFEPIFQNSDTSFRGYFRQWLGIEFL